MLEYLNSLEIYHAIYLVLICVYTPMIILRSVVKRKLQHLNKDVIGGDGVVKLGHLCMD